MIKKNNLSIMHWLQKRYFEFRAGNNIYVGFSIALANFILIAYRFFIESIVDMYEVAIDLAFFTVLFLIAYIPLTLVVGHWHYRQQEKIVQTMQFLQSPAVIRALRLLFELKTNTADQQDVDAFKSLLAQLDRKSMVRDLE
jgi:hypothetical protein